MSYTALVVFNGDKVEEIEFRNAWGGAARVWDAIFNRYVPKKHEYDSWVCAPMGDDRRLWDLYKRKDLAPFVRAVHMFTFDRFYISKVHFQRFAIDLTSFVEAFPVKGAQVDHLPAWADVFRKSDAVAIGLYGTSVGENVWCVYDGETGEYTQRPLSEGYEVYEQLEIADNEQQPKS